MKWCFRGIPYYLDAQAERLGLSKVLTDRARNNPEIYRVSVLLGHLCERHHRASQEDRTITPAELAQIRGTLGQCCQEMEKLHCLAGASQQMITEAYAAFGIQEPSRPFRIEVMS